MVNDTINLDEIIVKYKIDGNTESLKSCIKEVCNQLLEFAAENAELTDVDYFEATPIQRKNGRDNYANEDDEMPYGVIIVDKQSILNKITN